VFYAQFQRGFFHLPDAKERFEAENSLLLVFVLKTLGYANLDEQIRKDLFRLGFSNLIPSLHLIRKFFLMKAFVQIASQLDYQQGVMFPLNNLSKSFWGSPSLDMDTLLKKFKLLSFWFDVERAKNFLTRVCSPMAVNILMEMQKQPEFQEIFFKNPVDGYIIVVNLSNRVLLYLQINTPGNETFQLEFFQNLIFKFKGKTLHVSSEASFDNSIKRLKNPSDLNFLMSFDLSELQKDRDELKMQMHFQRSLTLAAEGILFLEDFYKNNVVNKNISFRVLTDEGGGVFHVRKTIGCGHIVVNLLLFLSGKRMIFQIIGQPKPISLHQSLDEVRDFVRQYPESLDIWKEHHARYIRNKLIPSLHLNKKITSRKPLPVHILGDDLEEKKTQELVKLGKHITLVDEFYVLNLRKKQKQSSSKGQ
jgi:hypothetical protein